MIKYLLIAPLFFALAVSAQEFEPVKKAFETGNVAALRSQLDATVELSLLGQEMEVGRGDAENQLRSFFDEHPPRSFSILHTGVSKSDVKYLIASFVSSGASFRVSIYMQKSGDKYLIQSLEIEAD